MKNNIEFAPGLRVIIRDEEWMIKKVETNSFENKSLECIGVSPLVREKNAIFLSDLEDVKIVNPADTKLVPDKSAKFKKAKLYIESNLRQKIPTDDKIHIGYKAAMDTLDYQLVPTMMSLKNQRHRILIADSVGLGKTLEAGILMSELIARGKGKRILVVTVKSMMMQFQKEMWNRFSIPLVRLDSNKIQKIRASLPSNYNPFFYYDKTIISVDTLKRDVEYRTHIENAYWDIIVIDEAHNVAERGNKEAQRAKLAKLLAQKSDSLILLSATPHDGKSESFASLMNMLDPTAIANPHDYTKDDIKGLCVRRFKKDVKEQLNMSFQERSVHIEKCQASMFEELTYEYFVNMNLEMDKDKTKGIGTLFKTSLEKAMFSSPAACIKSVDERIKKLVNKYGENGFVDIKTLKDFKRYLEQIDDSNFSRYQQLLKLIKNEQYNWAKLTDDRIVIFTERIETMKWLAEHLKKDLKLKANEVQEMYGGMSDIEQQEIVDSFGREESPIRILVASDVASEGINLHYLSHRLIHFDIPWSLMVFQQRNGRIDRYGQLKKPDIRYFLIQSSNEKIKGDSRIMEILINKEEQAYKNIGDPALLMGKFNVEEEEQEVASAIENNISSSDFENQIDNQAEEFDPFEAFMQFDDEEKDVEKECIKAEDKTLYSDLDYLSNALSVFNETTIQNARSLGNVKGIEITLDSEIKRRLKALLPDEALPENDKLKLSPDIDFIKSEMKRCMQNDLSETAWPSAQYLWSLHPIFNWINDKAKLLFGRDEAPLLGFKSSNDMKNIIYIISGSIYNRRSTPVIDEFFGVRFVNGEFKELLTIDEIINKTQLLNGINEQLITESNIIDASSHIEEAINQVLDRLKKISKEYTDSTIEETVSYMEKLKELKEKHYEFNGIQLSLFDDLNRKELLKKNQIDEVFDSYNKWYTDSVEIEEHPYIKIVAVMMEV